MQNEGKICHPYEESLWDQFDRIDGMINPRSFNRKFDIKMTYGKKILLEAFGPCS